MGVRQIVLVAALVFAGCASQSESKPPATGGLGGQSAGGAGGSRPPTGGTTTGAGGSGGSGTTGGSGGSTTATGGAGGGGTSTGGTSATGGSSGGATSGTGGTTTATGGTTGAGDASGGTPDMASTMPPMTGGKALLITGTIPIVGTDVKFKEALEARGLEVEIVQERVATPANAEGKRVIIMSYGMKSTEFKAEAYADVPVPIIVTEHFLLPRLKMTGTAHGFTGKMTRLTFVSDHELQGGFPKGDVEVYSPSQEFFWGTPTSAGIRIAHLTGQPDRVAYFAYDKGAMMEGLAAPAKRVQFFHASHSPDPIDRNLYLNANGLKLLGVTIDWCLK